MRETKVDATTPAPVVLSRLFGRAGENVSGDQKRLGLSRPLLSRSLPFKQPNCDTLIQSFNSWAFKREQPDNIERLRRLAETAIEGFAEWARYRDCQCDCEGRLIGLPLAVLRTV